MRSSVRSPVRPSLGPWPWPSLRSCGLLGCGLLIALGGACKPKPVVNDPNAHVPLATAPTWQNWSRNLVHKPALDGGKYYFSPTNEQELSAIIGKAAEAGVSVRVTGQRHSQPPLVAPDNRQAPPETTHTWIVDLSCYKDLGPNGDQDIVLDEGGTTITVNAGIREDQVDSFLTEHNLMLKTVTAGGFFSIGGMTAIDVNGATIDAPIFAETASAFTIMGADAQKTTIDTTTAAVDGWSPIQFARVSLGALGVVTSVTLDVSPRPHANSVVGGHDEVTITDEATFIAQYKEMLTKYDRLESFYNPYSGKLLALWWNEDPNPAEPVANEPAAYASACTFAEKDKPGAPFEVPLEERVAEKTEEYVQVHGNAEEAKLLINFAQRNIIKQVESASKRHSDLWLQEAARVVFMSYFLELPGADDAGLARAWKGIDAITQRLATKDFLIAGPVEFRFMRGGNTAMASTYSTTPDSLFINLDLLAFVPEESASQYPPQMLQFFADVERTWVEELGAFPHNGKMYGFYDPAGEPGNATAPFNPGFLAALAERRGERLQAFESFRQSKDPKGMFCNDFLRALTLCKTAS